MIGKKVVPENPPVECPKVQEVKRPPLPAFNPHSKDMRDVLECVWGNKRHLVEGDIYEVRRSHLEKIDGSAIAPGAVTQYRMVFTDGGETMSIEAPYDTNDPLKRVVSVKCLNFQTGEEVDADNVEWSNGSKGATTKITEVVPGKSEYTATWIDPMGASHECKLEVNNYLPCLVAISDETFTKDDCINAVVDLKSTASFKIIEQGLKNFEEEGFDFEITNPQYNIVVILAPTVLDLDEREFCNFNSHYAFGAGFELWGRIVAYNDDNIQYDVFVSEKLCKGYSDKIKYII